MSSADEYHEEKNLLTEDDDSTDESYQGELHGPDFQCHRCSYNRMVPLWTLLVSFLVTLAAIVTTMAALRYGTRPSLEKASFDFSGYACAPLEADPADARARGCEYDNFTMQWYPRERYERSETLELMNKFMDMGWPRHFDAGQKHAITDLERAPMFIYILSKEHIWHCGYSLLQTHLWWTMGFDPPMAYGHTEHCVFTMLDLIERYPPPDLYDVKRNGRSSLVPSEFQIVKPYFPCAEHGFACTSEDHPYRHS
ncbi:hypothetical protein COCHEDRAFT_1208237 [Bipolaris maydis C5]|uniref:Uncharacterized protein n=2 Tax=Cochliobolus heterostrophus TaxID=5016 RepID=M2TSX1_COCH5|nr:hypothetical protein COCHEDRAFT_1208237 [Bipolaris maydis C5]KAJ5029801.1 hypothetical protein J3E73DRAFT_227736 [Bipolaris maydis]KAJ5055173.1 hypothetical protein J3E74DRAFT_422486 [Bipolaris maydis]KAJ6203046.1 hypothetical protein J3E72DRAFT_381469 [Bipolaris maydis]KAJ6214395.1 hypothetical protein PSV09DRAFT_1208237 [Bipolaris maydis]